MCPAPCLSPDHFSVYSAVSIAAVTNSVPMANRSMALFGQT